MRINFAPCDGITRFKFKGFLLSWRSQPASQRPCVNKWSVADWGGSVNWQMGDWMMDWMLDPGWRMSDDRAAMENWLFPFPASDDPFAFEAKV